MLGRKSCPYRAVEDGLEGEVTALGQGFELLDDIRIERNRGSHASIIAAIQMLLRCIKEPLNESRHGSETPAGEDTAPGRNASSPQSASSPIRSTLMSAAG